MDRDVVTLIIQDHRDMQQLFARLRGGEGDRELLFQQMAAMLTAHSRAEEAEVYPVLAKAGESDEVTHAREEHAEADEMLGTLKTLDPHSDRFEELLTKLMDAVEHHIEEEESTHLPALRAVVGGDRLAELAGAFTVRRGAELEGGPSPRQVGGSELSREKLYAKAAEHDISGRSQMTRDELREAVKTAEGS